jgi:large subunit ribosomal protein L18
MKSKKETLRLKRHKRIRVGMSGTAERPRLVVRRSLKNFCAQVVDDTVNKTLFSLSTENKELKAKLPYAGNVKAAAFFGEEFAKQAKAKGFNQIIFDRAGYLYHGRVKAFAEGLRKGGLVF